MPHDFEVELRTLGIEIMTRRKQLEFSLREVAEAVHINPSTQSRIEGDTLLPKQPEIIRRLEEKLEFPQGYLAAKIKRREKEKRSLYRDYQNILGLLKMLLIVMSDDVLPITLLRVERRIEDFNEDRRLLALNLSDYFMGKLELDSEPANGLRPLIHYIANRNEAIDSWGRKSSKTATYTLPGEKSTAGLCGEPDRDNSNV